MNRFLQFLGLITFLIGIGYGILYLKSNSHFFDEALRLIGLLVLIITILYLIARLVWGKNWFLKGATNTIIGSDLINSIRQLLSELPKPSEETIATLAGNILYRLTRIGLFAVLVAFIPFILLWQ